MIKTAQRTVKRSALVAAVYLLIGTAQATNVTDDFSTSRDYLTGGVSGTIWDGVYNQSAANVLNTTGTAGELTIGTPSSAVGWDGTHANAPYLYKNVTGDFDVRVQVTAGTTANYTIAGLLVRLDPASADGNAGEDFVMVSRNWFGGGGNGLRSVNDNVQSGLGGYAGTHLRLTRTGNVFRGYTSSDGTIWTPRAWTGSTYDLIRADLAGTVQVGLTEGAFVTGNVTWVRFDNFSVEYNNYGELYWDTVAGDGAAITGGPGTWLTAVGNWNTGTSDTNWADWAVAVFGGVSGGTVTLGGPVTVSGLRFDTEGYALVSNVLTLAGATLTANASATISSQLAGSSGLTKSGTNALTLTGRNIYTGTTTVREGVLALAESVGYNATINGQTVVLTNGVLRWNASNNIKDTMPVTLRGGAADLQGYIEYFGGLTMSSNALFTGSTGWFILNGTSPGDVTTEGDGSAGMIAANMAIAAKYGSYTNNRTQTFSIAPGTSLTVSGAIANDNSGGGKIGSVLKIGAGTLTLSGANTYSGGTIVSNGVIVVGNDLAFGTNLVTLAGGGLAVTNGTRVTVNLFNLVQDAVFDVPTGSAWSSDGTVTNSGKLVKTGGGVLTLPLMGNGNVVVSGGTLKLPSSMPSGTVAFYKFNNPGALGADSSTNANTLVAASGLPVYTNSGKYGGALYLDGASTMNKGGVFPAGIPTGASPYTIALWEKDNGSGANGGFVGWGNNVYYQCNSFRFNGNNGLLNYWYGDSWAVTGLTTNPKDGSWHHLAVTWNGTSRTMYVDGKPVSTLTSSGPNVQAANFTVGRTTYPADPNFKGWIDDLLIANRALSSNEVVNLMGYSAAIVQNVTNSSARIDAGCVLDLSGNSQTFASLGGSGTVTGGTLTVTSTLTPGGTNTATGALAVRGGLTLAAGSTNRFDYTESASDVVNVTGTLAIEGGGTVELSAIGGALPPGRVTLFTFGELTGEENLAGWTVTGAGLESKNVRIRRTPNSLDVTISPRGTLIIIF